MSDNTPEVELEEWTEDAIEEGPEATNSWSADSIGDSLNDGEGPINPLAAIMASGTYDLDKAPDNGNIVQKGTYECELKSVEITEPNTFEGKNHGRRALRFAFVITDPDSGYMWKSARKNFYLPLPEENENPTEYSQELGDKVKQAYFALGIKRSEFATANLQEYLKTPCRVGFNVMDMPDGGQMNTISWFKAI